MNGVQRWVLTALGLALLAFPGQAQGQAPAESGGGGGAESARRGVRPGDQVVLDFYTAAGVVLHEVSGERLVDESGELFLPYIGDVYVLDRTADEIRDMLVERYESYYQAPVIDVQIKFRVNITGAVRSPGNYLVEPTTTIVDVVSLAGGLGTSVSQGVPGGAADASRIHLFRDGDTSVIDLRAGKAEAGVLGMPVISGDWIWVPAEPLSAWRENVTLIGGVLSIAASLVWIAAVTN